MKIKETNKNLFYTPYKPIIIQELILEIRKLLSENLDFDYLDTLYRSKFKFGKKDEVLIKLN